MDHVNYGVPIPVGHLFEINGMQNLKFVITVFAKLILMASNEI